MYRVTITREDHIYYLHTRADDARMLGNEEQAQRLEVKAAELLRRAEQDDGLYSQYAYANADDADTKGWSV